jgi:hypothetical protein
VVVEEAVTWIRKRPPRHSCADHLPESVPVDVNEGDKWKCSCHRRWELMDKAEPLEEGQIRLRSGYLEGDTIEGPDGSVYWRAGVFW